MRTLPANITGGYAAGAEAVILIIVTTQKGAGTSFYWSTKATSAFTSWTGATFVPLLKKISPTRHMSSIAKGTGKSQLSNIDFEVQNIQYSGSTSLWDWAIANEKYWKGASVEVRLINNYGSGLDEDDAITIFEGICQKTLQTLEAIKFFCQDESKNIHLKIPQTQITESSYEDWNSNGYGNDSVLGKFIPITFGLGDFAVLLTDTDSDYTFSLDTETCYSGGTLKTYEDGKWRTATQSTSFNGKEISVSFALLYIDVHSDLLPTAVLSAGGHGTGGDWINPGYAIDGSMSSYADSRIDADWDNPRLKFTFDDLDYSEMEEIYFMAYAKAAATDLTDNNEYSWRHNNYIMKDDILDDGPPDEAPRMEETEANSLYSSTLQRYLNMADMIDKPEIWFWCIRVNTTTGAYIEFYEWAKLRWHLKAFPNNRQFIVTSASGREFGGTWGGRKIATNTIVFFVDAIEAILRQELGLSSTIDTATFDAALITLNAWTGKAYNSPMFKIVGQQRKQLDSEEVIDQICSESGLHYCINAAGKHQLFMLSSDRTADYTVENADIEEGSLDKIKTSDHNEFYNSFVINYNVNQATGEYRNTITINKDSGIPLGDPHYYLQRRCNESHNRYGLTRLKTVNCDWIGDAFAAWKYIDWLCYFYCFERKYLQFKSKSHGLLKAENMDVALIKHKLTNLTSGEKYLLYETKTVSSEMKAYTEHKGMYIETMGDRDDNPT